MLATPQELKFKGCSDKYIKNELSGIRYIHNQTSDTKYTLTDPKVFNEKVLELGSTKDGRVDRSWTDREFKEMIKKCQELGRADMEKTIVCIRDTGMRLDEGCTLKRNQVEEALKTGKLHLENTKGGRPRDINLTENARETLERVIVDVPRGGYVLTPQQYVDNHKIQNFEKAVEDFVRYHRSKIQDSDRKGNAHNVLNHERAALTPHGLRHTYARDELYRLKERMPEREARQLLAEELGHGRESVTGIYVPKD